MIDDKAWLSTFGWYVIGIIAMATLIGAVLVLVTLSGCAGTETRREQIEHPARHGCPIRTPGCG